MSDYENEQRPSTTQEPMASSSGQTGYGPSGSKDQTARDYNLKAVQEADWGHRGLGGSQAGSLLPLEFRLDNDMRNLKDQVVKLGRLRHLCERSKREPISLSDILWAQRTLIELGYRI